MSMLFLSLSTPDIPEDLPPVDGIELRLDHWPKVDLTQVRSLLRTSPKPLLLTLRKTSQGGRFQGAEPEREKTIQELLALEPPYFDLEGEMRSPFLQSTIGQHPKTQFILSHHDFEKTPENLEEIHNSLSRYSPFACKIAAMAKSSNDALRLLLFARHCPGTSAIPMGEKGEFGRLLGKIVGNPVDYTVLQGQMSTGPGQIFAQELFETYNYSFLNRQTAIYGLIGDPVAKSRGHIYHNQVFRERNVKALYIKMIVRPEELELFIRYAKEIGIRGLSVTIPLKEKILPFVDEMDETTARIGAVNTLLFTNGRLYGTNTDAAGAVDAIEKQEMVRGKKVVLLGAGGAARAIAFEAKWRGAQVVILNRTLPRAEELAAAVGGEAGSLEEVPADADILINCTPEPMPIDPDRIPKNSLAMDIVTSPRATEFLQEALARRCRVVYGDEMWLNQAQAQTLFWGAFPNCG